MKEDNAPCFVEVNKALSTAELYINAAEAHGILSGIICGGDDLNSPHWKAHFNDTANEGLGLPVAVNKIVERLYSDTLNKCLGNSLSFTLLLPDDERPLVERADSIAKWSQGFLAGFGMVQQNLNKAEHDVQEVIRDIRDISQLALDVEYEGEESEIAYVEIVEYLRVAAMLCFDYFSTSKNNKNKQKLH